MANTITLFEVSHTYLYLWRRFHRRGNDPLPALMNRSPNLTTLAVLLRDEARPVFMSFISHHQLTRLKINGWRPRDTGSDSCASFSSLLQRLPQLTILELDNLWTTRSRLSFPTPQTNLAKPETPPLAYFEPPAQCCRFAQSLQSKLLYPRS